MNRFEDAVRELIDEYGEPTPMMREAHNDEEINALDRRIYYRLGRHLVAFDGLTPVEVATINRVLFYPSEAAAFETWVVDQYLIRAHALEICRWPPTPFGEFPAELKPAFDRFGLLLLDQLRNAAA